MLQIKPSGVFFIDLKYADNPPSPSHSPCKKSTVKGFALKLVITCVNLLISTDGGWILLITSFCSRALKYRIFPPTFPRGFRLLAITIKLNKTCRFI